MYLPYTSSPLLAKKFGLVQLHNMEFDIGIKKKLLASMDTVTLPRLVIFYGKLYLIMYYKADTGLT